MRSVPFRHFLRHWSCFGLLVIVALALPPVTHATEPVLIEHQLTVQLDPQRQLLRVTDTLTLPPETRIPVRFWLGAGFTPRATGATLSRLDADPRGRFHAWPLQPEGGRRTITLEYGASIGDTPRSPDHGMPMAWLDASGVYLDGGAGWVPRFDGDALRFSMTIEGPTDWTWISQGQRSADGTRWSSRTPLDDLYLLGGPFARETQTHGAISLETDLLQADPDLSRRYLTAMGGYIDFFSALVGPYPYPRFAVVENRWQTGYGMPGFTLLGSQVMRLPFILHTSLPHEILHNWWGNGVWIDARGGNWSEGLTAYLADHLIKEAAGGGAEYRRKLLERYTSFASEGRDIALREFRTRHSDATQAVGYGKMLMLYHMQRRRMGDAPFVRALRDLWSSRQFSAADMNTVLATLAGGVEAPAFGPRWLDAPGAPQLSLAQVDALASEDGQTRLSIRIEQVQAGPAYPLDVPVFVKLADGRQLELSLPFTDKRAQWSGSIAGTVLSVDADPFFDVFRRLDPAEQPASLARLFGAPTQYLILPTRADEAQRAAWDDFANAWQARFNNVRTLPDSAIDTLPTGAAFWVLGRQNLGLPDLRQRLADAGQMLEGDTLIVPGQRYAPATSAVVLLDPDNRRAPMGFIGAEAPADIAGLARKLPHYSTYGRLVFAAGSLERQVAETLPVTHSPLRRVLTAQDPGPPSDPRPPLAAQVDVPLPGQR